MGRSWSLRLTALLGFCWFCQIATIAADHSIRFLPSELESLNQRLELAQSATRSIDIASFQIRDDDTGGQILASLVQAARRGVSVRLLVDAHPGSNNLPKHLMRYLIEQGVCIRERPVDVRYKLEVGRPRLHDKLFIVDDTWMIIGGRNLEQDFFGVGERLYVDLDAIVVGPAVQDATRYYDSRWKECQSGQPRLAGHEPKKMLRKQVHPRWNLMSYEEAFCEIETWLAGFSIEVLEANDLPCRSPIVFSSTEPCRIEFVHDFVCGHKSDAGAISDRILSTLRQARSSIEISSPYFVISNALQQTLRRAVERGVRVTVLTNSLESSDQVIAFAGYANQRRSLIRDGIHVKEYQGTRTLHAKLIIVDGAITYVGSHNLDMLSERRNSETGLLVHSCEFASQAKTIFQSFVRQSDSVERGELLRREARQSDADNQTLREFQRLRLVAPFIKRYL